MLIVQKYGGSSVANAERVLNVAKRIMRTRMEGHDVVVVLSAQGKTTDGLIAKAKEINHKPSRREMDMLLSTGEQQSVALMSMAISALIRSLRSPVPTWLLRSSAVAARCFSCSTSKIDRKSGV